MTRLLTAVNVVLMLGFAYFAWPFSSIAATFMLVLALCYVALLVSGEAAPRWPR